MHWQHVCSVPGRLAGAPLPVLAGCFSLRVRSHTSRPATCWWPTPLESRQIVINRLRKAEQLPDGNGETAGFMVDRNSDRVVANLDGPAGDGTRFVRLDQVVNRAAAYTVKSREVGKTFGFNATTGFTITLPAASAVPAGEFEFLIVQTAGSGNHAIDILATDTIVGAGASGGAGEQLDLTGFAAGDAIKLKSDGVSKYYIVERVTSGVDTSEIADSAVTTAKIANANVTPAKTNIVQARTASSDGAGTGTISADATHVTVTSGNADHIVVLPPPVVGRFLVIDVGATGFELRSNSPATVAINGGSGANAESAIPANSTVFATCVSTTAWKAFYMDADGDLAKVEAAAAA